MYYSTDYKDTEKRRAILTELLGGIGENVAVGNPCRVIRQFTEELLP